MISNCGHDENNRYKGGKAGDQTGGEWALIKWYNRPWKCVLRHPDAKVRKMISDMATAAAKNNKIGYDQSERYTFWQHLKASGYDPAGITVACEADCSSGVAAIVKAAGYRLGIQKLKDVSIYCYTGNLRAALEAAGFEVLTGSKYLTGDAYLIEGDILLNDSCHTAINVTAGAKASASGGMKTGKAGLSLIKQFEGCRLESYKCPADVWTIGYGHTSGVKAGQVITQAQADAFLVSDVEKFEKKVNKYYEKYGWNQNEFDALVSFAFNIGSIDQLTANGTRSRAVIAEKMVQYNKASGKVLAGLTKRRQAERKLFLNESGWNTSGGVKSDSTSSVKVDAAQGKDKSLSGTYEVTASDFLSLRAGAGTGKTEIAKMQPREKVQCYGYYTDVSGVKWLYVVYKGITGFCSSKYLKKK